MTRLFLVAGVAALAIAAPAAAKPGGGHGGGGDQGNKGGAPAAASQGGGGGGHGHGGGGGGAPAFNPGGGGGAEQRAAEQQMKAARQDQARHGQDQARHAQEQQFKAAREAQAQARRGQEQARHAQEKQFRGARQAQEQARRDQEQQVKVARQAQEQFRHGREQQFKAQRQAQEQGRHAQEQQFKFEREAQHQQAEASKQRFEFARKAQEQAFNQSRDANKRAFDDQRRFAEAQRRFANFDAGAARAQQRSYDQYLNASRFAAFNYGGGTILAPTLVDQFVGAPIGQVANFASLSPLPTTIQYLYPETPDYYYRYGNGYLYQVDRGSNLVDMLLPLLGGGYLPGQYLPASYMASYVPDYYGYNSFYPDYGDQCNRYYQGVIYQVDCNDGYVENVVPVYDNGYGVGQLLPSAYSYYNVPTQYRSVYYDTPDYGYWYAPGAIYQYDQRSSAITSVAALLSPGFTVGQALPVGYDVYNVPYAYRQTYYDTPDAWYRYNNGYIYQVDPVTQLVTSVVASLLT